MICLNFKAARRYGTPFATKFRQNVIVCASNIKSIFEDRFLIIDFLQLIFDYTSTIFDNRFLIIDFLLLIFDYTSTIFDNRFLIIDFCS